MKYGYKPTTHGRALLAKCAAIEQPLVLTRVAFGSGVVPEEVNLADVHALIHDVADGTIGARTHENDRLCFAVQYANSEHPDVPTFYLNEFIVYARDPETEADVDLLYATLGDYSQPVPAYAPGLPPSVWNFPLVLVVSDEVEVSVTAAPGLVTHEDLRTAIETACRQMAGGVCKTITFTIPADAWQTDPAPVNGYALYTDLADGDVTAELIPQIVFEEASLETVKQCGVCPTAYSYAGHVRLKCAERPTAEITGVCYLTAESGAGAGTGTAGIFGLPVASESTLGGVMIRDGSGLHVDEEGYLSVDAATNKEVTDTVEEVFGESNAGGSLPDNSDGDYEIATDEEVRESVDDIFGEKP